MNSPLIPEQVSSLLGEHGIDLEELFLFQKLARTSKYCHLSNDRIKFFNYLLKNIDGLIENFTADMKNVYGSLYWVADVTIGTSFGLPFKNLLEKARFEGLISKEIVLIDRSIVFNQIYDPAPDLVVGLYEANTLSLPQIVKNAKKYNFYRELNPREIFLAFEQTKECMEQSAQYYYYSRDDHNQLCRFCFHKVKYTNDIKLSIGKVHTAQNSIYEPKYVTLGQKPTTA